MAHRARPGLVLEARQPRPRPQAPPPGRPLAAARSDLVGAKIEENWAALFATTELFGRVAREVGAALGFAYAETMDADVSEYLRDIRTLDRKRAR